MGKELAILNNWEKAKNAIAICKDIDELKVIRDKAEALRAYVKQAKEGLEVQNNICDIKLRAERRIGKFSKKLPTQERKRTDLSASHDGKQTKTDILEQAGIEHYERYEAIASLPEEEFEKHIEEIKASNKELTTVGVIRLARKLQPKPKSPPLPKGKYSVIYADPPWDVKAGPEYNSGGESRNLEYPTMTVEEIEKMSVEAITNKNAHLYLWTINKYIEDAYKVARKWGFEPTCLLTWCKPPHGIGLGGTFIQTTEYLLFCRKGTLTANKRIDTTWWKYKRGKHSVKPPEFRKMIEEVSPGKRIELFAREKTKGWDVWGNEVK